jgi:hypothetical protein
MIPSLAAMLALLWASPVTTEMVEVPDRGAVDLAPFACTDTPHSTLVRRVCYDDARLKLLVNAEGIYSEYCGLPASTFEAFVVAPSMGQFFRQHIAAGGTKFSCRAD